MAGAVTTGFARRIGAVVLALAFVAGGCGEATNDGAPGQVGDETQTPTGGASGATSPDGARSDPDRPTATTRKLGGSASDGGPPNLVANADDGDLRAAARGAPGGFAGVLLAPGPADRLVLDVLVHPSVAADSAVIATMRQTLAAFSEKTVTLRGPAELKASGSEHSADDLRRIADEQGSPQGNGTAVIHLLYMDGEYSDEGALGVAVRGDVIAVFPEQLDRVTSPFVSRSRIERAVVTHEVGHLLGLVDLYLDEGRADPDHPGHSTSSRSVMYWAVESDLVLQVLDGPPPVDFDADDQEDLRKIHKGARPAA